MIIQPFAEVVKKYDAFFFDAYGVLNDYSGMVEGIDHTIRTLINNGKEVLVLTNDASRSPRELSEKYRSRGIGDLTADKIVSSGMLAREYLRYKVEDGVVAYLGTKDSAHYLEALGLATISISDVELDDINKINALVFLDDEGFDWNHDLSKTINLLRKRNMPVVVANTDYTYPVARNHINIATGGLAFLIERIVGKTFIRFGKPSTQMFQFAYQQLTKTQYVSKNKILMIGDTLHTDIIGGNKFGIDTALVLTGNTLKENAKFHIHSTGIIPNYICEAAVL